MLVTVILTQNSSLAIFLFFLHFSTVPAQTSDECEGTWGRWLSSSPCTEKCGNCGTQSLVRSCINETIGCPCIGNTATTATCNPTPCAFPQPSCCNSFTVYNMSKDAGVSPTLILIVGSRWSIGMVASFFNASLVYVTIKNRSIHNPCNIFLAFNALYCFVYELGHNASMFIVLTGINFIELQQCFYLQSVSLFGILIVPWLALAIGVDRLVSIIFPIWANKQNVFTYSSIVVSICSSYGLVMLWIYCRAIRRVPDLPTICGTSDLAQSEAMIISSTISAVICVLTIVIYLIVWFILRIKTFDKVQASSPSSNRIFKSLMMLVGMEVFGWLLNIVTRYLVVPNIQLTPMQGYILSTCLTCFTNFAMLSNAPILYTFSRDYRRAFQAHFTMLGKVEESMVLKSVRSMPPEISKNNNSFTNVQSRLAKRLFRNRGSA
uniref:G-protein coupled receptors family 1 profile domain-containing protein n=1 Tax=Ditylenchus dipsaci TaxID=166011 RepID=A0A915CYR7_9BILA